MDKWTTLAERLPSPDAPGEEELCRKIFQGSDGSIPGLERLLIDKLGRLLFVLTYAPLEGEELARLVRLLEEAYPGCFIRIQERGGGPARELFASAALPGEMTLREEGLSYLMHPARGQNLGFFPDMIQGRRRVAAYVRESSSPPRVLNLFSYTCSFSVAALSAGAARVDNWDMNRNSLAVGRRNHRLNGLEGREKRDRYFGCDIFKSFGKLRKNGPYDLLILDPPPHQGGSFSYRKDYPKLIGRLGQWLRPGGAALLCLNAADCGWEEFREMIAEALTGGFARWEALPPPAAYVGRFPDRGLKCYFLTDWDAGRAFSEES